ncbi:50S ribosomal protein L11 methyltransferase [Haliovirga abyssi]|uniref:Ribosomal protein L11 methyltransferase n=1 Tax=Haliovirga abyssi TaxID=2996794 RepID=A0AAU9DZL0_9FUSO|nr:50S ribosomal protein L11 methyltransferase [Haliovirga abyssi]BDU51005.1 ribosomal protein L11 methyltransferase [Haliovirga abyssi]
MKWEQVEVMFDSDNIEATKDKIMNIFYDFGVRDLQIDEPMEKNPLDYYSNEHNFFRNNYSIIGYFPMNIYLEDKKIVFEEKLTEISEKENFIFQIFYGEVDEKDWQNVWKKYFFPEKIGERIVVKPTWKDYEKKDEDEIIIEIDPGLAFGTGTHPTTFLCVKMLEKYIKSGDSLLDIGTGSGILMIAGDKLGAGSLYGTDIDEEAIKAAEENLLLNGVLKDKFTIKKGDLLEAVCENKFDIVVSNILAKVIMDLLDDITKVIKSGGLFITSGIILEQKELVISKMKRVGFEIIDIMEEDGWISVVGRI